MNRGIARRTIFESGADARVFLAAMARCVRRGWLEVHAYCLMATHYHLLVRSPVGRLGDAMQRIQLGYSRSFIRGRRGDGPLERGRCRSKLVDDIRYRRVLVAYIDANPVQAQVVRRPAEYGLASARHYASASGPRWLERSWIESEVRFASGGASYQPRRYDEVFGAAVPEALREVVDRRIRSGAVEDPLDELLRATPREVLAWMRRRAALADGARPGLPVCAPSTVDEVIDAARVAAGEACVPRTWYALRAGLSHSLASSPQHAIARRMGCSSSQAGSLVRIHRRRMCAEREYAEQAAGMASEVLRLWERAGSGGG